MPIKVLPVSSKKERAEFIRVPYKLLKRYKAWVPPLLSEVKTTLNPEKNPFFQHASCQLFLAKVKNRCYGRIAAIIDQNYIESQQEMVGLFGFFDVIDDLDIARALFNTASQWLREEGMKKMLGPSNPSMNDELGVLVDAFDIAPAVKMVWNPPYYKNLYEQCHFEKAMDLKAWKMHADEASERVMRMGELLKRRTGIELRNPNIKQFDREIAIFRRIYNQAWSGNWGFVPWTEAEFDHAARSLKQIIDTDLVFIAELDGKPVGFSLTLPDINQALIKTNGRLFPFGLLKLLWYSRKIDATRAVILGVLPEYRNKGIDTIMYAESIKIVKKKGLPNGEMSWILENNLPMIKALEMLGAKPYKTYRIYERPL